ncbi:WD40 repeat-like protein [Wolfiporia cocos MD-104 SS10]|uniref:WD40 repeat-like protein n=1 Tax=Wolfiporia cocos (strain MD-104) TaxID=742152 RepID=A0A2H3JLP1_WOLCO|nr:WD40 repeat-like protein [Wolfiporia cocos MD-104 SS10]
MRSGSVCSFATTATTTTTAAAKPPVPESATWHLRASRVVLDFSPAEPDRWPVSWSESNVLVFARGNRVICKDMSANDTVGQQLCKLSDHVGQVRLIECARARPNVVAVCTDRSQIEVWDLAAKKLMTKWTTDPATAMHWNGMVLTVGGERGRIRHFDIREEARGSKEVKKKNFTRHNSAIRSVAWNADGKLFASGDESGVVLVWDSRQNAPLDVGELVQRRNKIQHNGAVHALAWCPWLPNLFATGDSAKDGTGTIKVWNMTPPSSKRASTHPTTVELDAEVTSLHFSPHCKELLSTHGPGKSTPAAPVDHLDAHATPAEPIRSRIANSVVVHSYPSLRQVTNTQVAGNCVAGSVLSPNGQRVAIAIPKDSKLNVWEVWGKQKELRRSSSVMSMCTIR